GAGERPKRVLSGNLFQFVCKRLELLRRRRSHIGTCACDAAGGRAYLRGYRLTHVAHGSCRLSACFRGKSRKDVMHFRHILAKAGYILCQTVPRRSSDGTFLLGIHDRAPPSTSSKYEPKELYRASEVLIDLPRLMNGSARQEFAHCGLDKLGVFRILCR